MTLLLDQHIQHLRTSELNDEMIAAMNCESVTADQVARLLNWPHQWTSGGIVFPYPNVSNHCQIRFDIPQAMQEKDRKPRKIRYLKPKGSSNHAYILKSVQEVLNNAEVTLCITEGEKKAAKLTQEGFHTVGISGVWSWLTTTEGEEGKRQKGVLLPELQRISWNGRRVYLIWDSDAIDKPNVMKAGERLRATLSRRGAQVYLVPLPGTSEKKYGADDFLVEFGPVQLMGVLDEGAKDSDLRNFEIPRIVKMETSPAVYRVSIYNEEVIMTIKELMSFKQFQRTVAEICNRVPFMKNSRSEWELYVDELFNTVLEQEPAPEEASQYGLIWEHTLAFLKHEITEDRFVEGGHGPLRNETNFYIHGTSLLQYLHAEMGTASGPLIWTALRQRGASKDQKWFQDADQKWLKRRVWVLPTSSLDEPMELEGQPAEF